MQSKQQFHNPLSRTISAYATAALAIATVFALTVVLTQSAQAQTYKVIYNFTGGPDGANPGGGLTMRWSRKSSMEPQFWREPRRQLRHDRMRHGIQAIEQRLWLDLNPLYAFAGGDDGATPAPE